MGVGVGIAVVEVEGGGWGMWVRGGGGGGMGRWGRVGSHASLARSSWTCSLHVIFISLVYAQDLSGNAYVTYLHR